MTTFVRIMLLWCSTWVISSHGVPHPEQFTGKFGVNLATSSVILNRTVVGRLSTSDSEDGRRKGILVAEAQWHISFLSVHDDFCCRICRNSDKVSGMSLSGADDTISSTNWTWSQWYLLYLHVAHWILGEPETHTTPYPEFVRTHTAAG